MGNTINGFDRSLLLYVFHYLMHISINPLILQEHVRICIFVLYAPSKLLNIVVHH